MPPAGETQLALMHNEESKKGKKTYDLKIIKWLFSLTGPYRKFMALALMFMVFTALLELAVPLIAKTAIDKYIYPSWRIATFTDSERDKNFEETLESKYPHLIVQLGKNSYLVDTSELGNADRHNLEKFGIVSEERYLAVNPADAEPDKRSAVNEIIKENPGVFQRAGEVYYSSYNSLHDLSQKDLLALRGEEISRVIRLAALLMLCLLGIFIFSAFFTYILNYSGQKIMHSIRTDVFSHVISLPQSFFDKNPVGRLTTRVTSDVNAVNEMYTSVMVQFFKDILVVIGIFIVMFYMSEELTYYVILLTVLMGVFAGLFRMKLKTVYREIRRSIAKLNAFVQESVRGIVLIKLYNREMENYEKFKGVNRENYKANMDQLWVYATFRPFIEFTSVFTVAFILWYGGMEVLRLDITLGALIAYLYYVRMLFRPIMELAERYNIFQSAAAATENLYELVQVEPEESGYISDKTLKGKLEFRNVWFSYDNKEWVLKDVSFTIEPGETVALVGLTGSGKTTIVNLILKFYDIDRGQILFDGVDIKELNPEYIRRNIAAVFQDLFLFAKSISEDGGGSSNEFSKIVHIDDISETNGRSISSGEKQLVSLSQAFSKEANFMILDEATSSIDANIEKKVQEVIHQSPGGRTTLIIAHRLSNVRDADRIMVIHKGEISEVGTHQALLAKKGIYYNLYQLQNEIQRFSSLNI